MGFEKNEKQDENKEKLEKAFENDSAKFSPDQKKGFEEIIGGMKNYDSLASKEENFKNAFRDTTNELVEKNLANISPEKKEELKKLRDEALKNENNIENMINAYNEIKSVFDTINGSSAQAGERFSKIQEEQAKANKENQTSFDKFKNFLKTNCEEQAKANKEKQEKLAKQIQEAKEEGNKEKANAGIEAEGNLKDKWPA